MTWEIRQGDALDRLREMPAESVQCCITSPPYFGLRDYGTGEWEGGEDSCDHVSGMARKDTERKTPGGRGGSFRGGELQFRDACGKCGARRTDRQLGLEPTPDEYVAKLVEVFREVRRVLRADGTCWINIGDSYNSASQSNGHRTKDGGRSERLHGGQPYSERDEGWPGHRPLLPGLKPKDLLGVPWLLAFALRADGWCGGGT